MPPVQRELRHRPAQPVIVKVIRLELPSSLLSGKRANGSNERWPEIFVQSGADGLLGVTIRNHNGGRHVGSSGDP